MLKKDVNLPSIVRKLYGYMTLSIYSCKAGLRHHKPNVKLMLMTAFELTEMEMKGEGLSLRIVFAAEVESKVPKAERRQTLMEHAKAY
jgi:hypothetical protein